jgi:hypothetical protein
LSNKITTARYFSIISLKKNQFKFSHRLQRLKGFSSPVPLPRQPQVTVILCELCAFFMFFVVKICRNRSHLVNISHRLHRLKVFSSPVPLPRQSQVTPILCALCAIFVFFVVKICRNRSHPVNISHRLHRLKGFSSPVPLPRQSQVTVSILRALCLLCVLCGKY